MSLLINGNPPSFYGVSVSARSYRSGNADTLRLSLIRQNAAGDVPGLSYGDDVVLTRAGATLFRGVIREVPKAESANSATQEVTAYGPWDALERLVFQRERPYFTGVDGGGNPVTLSHWSGQVIFDQSLTTGARIEEVLNYAAVQSGKFAVGAVAAGISWTASEARDQTCAELIRQLMALTPDLAVAVDYSPLVPVISVVKNGSATQSIALAGLADFSVTNLDAQVADEVVLRYERSNTVDGEVYLSVSEDTAGGDGTGRSDNAYVRTIPVQGFAVQYEYATIATAALVQAGDPVANKAEWWVARHAELAAIEQRVVAAAPGLAGTLAGLLKFATADVPLENILAHRVAIVGDPERTPLEGSAPAPSTDPANYPRELTSGALPEWTQRRYRQAVVSATVGIKTSDLGAIESPSLKAALEAIFTKPKTINGDACMVDNFGYNCVATNASKSVYKRVVSSSPAEPDPVGLAAAVRAIYSRTRRAGSVTLIEQEPGDVFAVGQAINLTGGEAAWATMAEVIQSVDVDEQTGATTVAFGPPAQLTAEDLVERLRVARRNPVQYGFDANPTAALGGIAATANSMSDREGGGGGGGAVECVLGGVTDNGDGTFTLRPGYITGGNESIWLEPTLTPAGNGHVWVKVSWTAIEADDVLQDGGVMTAAVPETGASIPSSTTPTVGSLSGTFYFPLGQWSAAAPWEFSQGGCGSLGLEFCAQSGFKPSRI